MGFSVSPSLGTSIQTAELDDGAVTDGKLASPNNSSYKVIHEARGGVNTSAANGTTYMLFDEYTNIVPGATTGVSILPFDFVSTDYAVTNLTTKLNVLAGARVNNTAPTATLTVGLYPVTAIGGGTAAIGTVTLGTVTTGSTVGFTTPAANSITRTSSGDFDAPATGIYALAVAISTATIVANSYVAIHAQVRRRNV